MVEMRHIDFNYYLNIIHYCIWVRERNFDKRYHELLNIAFSPIKYLLPKQIRLKYEIRKEKANKYFYELINDKKNGYSISWAHFWFGWFYSDYPCFVSFTTLGILMRLYGNVAPGVLIILFVVPIGLAYIPVYNAVFKKDKYLAYFKQFEKEDEQWHKKWKRKTMLFCFGGTTIFILGIVTIFFIASL